MIYINIQVQVKYEYLILVSKIHELYMSRSSLSICVHFVVFMSNLSDPFSRVS